MAKDTTNLITLKVEDLNLSRRIQRSLDEIVDDTLMLQIQASFERYCEPYVPFLSGTLAQSTEVSPEGVRYYQPYAHYQYTGEGFNFTRDFHPRATAYWDKVMMQERGEAFCKEVKKLVKRRAREKRLARWFGR